MKQKELWKDIPGYEDKYQASTEGHIRSLDYEVNGKSRTGNVFTRRIKGRVLKPGPYSSGGKQTGHLSVMLGREGGTKPVHQLIAATFIGPCPEGQEVRHKNGGPTDNRLVNLEYGTRRENILDVYRIGGRWRKLTAEEALDIRTRLERGEPGRALAQEYGVSNSTVSRIRLRRTFSWL